MRLLTALLSFGLVLAGFGAVLVAMIFAHYSKDLPDYSYLKDYQPPTLSRIYADDGRMMAVVAEEQRIFVPINAIPKRVKDAFLSAEDADFYQHGGVDLSRRAPRHSGQSAQYGARQASHGRLDHHAAGRQKHAADQRSVDVAQGASEAILGHKA